MSIRRTAARALAALALLLVAAVAVAWLALRHPLPHGTPGPAADALAHDVERAVNNDAWRRTRAVRFTFAGQQHLWDRERNYDRLTRGDWVLYVDTAHPGSGKALHHGREVGGDEARKKLEGGWARWANDTFWLNPLFKLFDDGVERSIADVDGAPALVVHYQSGGVTPGDTYVWRLDDNKRPRAWRTYVKVLPIGGIEFTWEGWTTLPTGAVISTVHRVAGSAVVRVADLAAAQTLSELEPGADPFAILAGK